MKKLAALFLLCAFALLAVPASATTKVYFKQPASGAKTTFQYGSITQSVLAAITSVTNSAASGTNIQWTLTAGGTTSQFLSPPLAAGATISGTFTANIWGFESNIACNCAARVVVVLDVGGTGSCGGATIIDTSNSAEYNTTPAAAQTWTGSPTSTQVNAGDRLCITPRITNVGTMGAARTVTNSYGGATGGAAGDTYVQFNENLSFQSEPEFIQMIQKFTASGTTQNMAVSGSVPAGHLIIFPCGYTTAANNCTPTDSVSSVYTALAPKANWNGTAQTDQFFWAISASTATPTYTMTMNGASTNLSMTVADFACINASPLDATPATNNTGSSAAPASTAFTPIATNTLIVGIENGNFGVTTTAGTGFVLRSAAVSPTTHTFEDKLIYGASSQTPAVSMSGSLAWLMSGASFKCGTQPSNMPPAVF